MLESGTLPEGLKTAPRSSPRRASTTGRRPRRCGAAIAHSSESVVRRGGMAHPMFGGDSEGRLGPVSLPPLHHHFSFAIPA